ncbi:hypothetical protein D3C77_479810 [compost metagenome]
MHFLPDNLGGISDEKYAAIVKQREADDKKRADIRTQRKAALDGVVPQVQPNTASADGWKTISGTDIPMTADEGQWQTISGTDVPNVPSKLAVIATPPVTPPTQPAVNGQAVNNSVVYNINVTTGDTTISGVETDKVNSSISDVHDKLMRTMEDSIRANSPSAILATQTRARGN